MRLATRLNVLTGLTKSSCRPLEYGDPALAHEMAAESVTQYVRAIGEID